MTAPVPYVVVAVVARTIKSNYLKCTQRFFNVSSQGLVIKYSGDFYLFVSSLALSLSLCSYTASGTGHSTSKHLHICSIWVTDTEFVQKALIEIAF